MAHVYLDPVNPPTQVMLQWNDGTWEHRAYWGANQIGWGVDGTVSRQNIGVLPPTGQWVRLEVPASLVGLEGRTLNGMAFTLFNGRATWDHAGKYAGAAGLPTISISDATVNEGNNGITPAVFNVTLSSASTQMIKVNFTTEHGTTDVEDINGGSGTVTFFPGETSNKKISISVRGDTVVEPNEIFFVNLSNPVNATIADGQGVGTILNDDVPPISIYISDATVFEGSCGGTPSAPIPFPSVFRR